MLEKSDLQQIREIIKEEVQPIVESQLKPISRSLLKLEAGLRKTNRDIDIIVRTFDRDYLGLKERVASLEDKVGVVR